MHEFGGNQCTITLAAAKPTKGWVTEHLPIGTEIINHNGTLEIDTEEIEPGTIPNRFLFENMTALTITYTTNQPIGESIYYWVGWEGKASFGYN